MKVGANGFGLRDSFAKGIDEAIAELKEVGLTSIEVCVEFIEQAPERRAGMPKDDTFKNVPYAIWSPEAALNNVKKIREAGLAVISCHTMIFLKDPKEVLALKQPILDFAKKSEICNFVLSPMMNLEQIQAYIPTIKELSDELAANGLNLLLHNHESECEPSNGTTALDELMKECPNLKLELDVGWAKFAGADAVAIMKKYSDRLQLVHLKDIKEDASPETRSTCFTAIGEGSIPLKEIVETSRELKICEHGIIIDQDASPTGMLEDLRIGIANVSKYN